MLLLLLSGLPAVAGQRHPFHEELEVAAADDNDDDDEEEEELAAADDDEPGN